MHTTFMQDVAVNREDGRHSSFQAPPTYSQLHFQLFSHIPNPSFLPPSLSPPCCSGIFPSLLYLSLSSKLWPYGTPVNISAVLRSLLPPAGDYRALHRQKHTEATASYQNIKIESFPFFSRFNKNKIK